jgi:hypothetical protein
MRLPRYLYLLFPVAALLATSRIRAQETPPPITAIVTTKHLTDEERAALLSVIGHARPLPNWKPIIVQASPDLSTLIQREYGYSAAAFPLSSTAIRSLITSAIVLGTVARLTPGQKLQIPVLPLPVRDTTSKTQLTQLVTDASSEVLTVDAAAALRLPPEEVTRYAVSPSQADTWTLRLSQVQAQALRNLLNTSLAKVEELQQVWIGPVFELPEVFTAEQPCDASAEADGPAPGIPPIALGDIQPSLAGKYYIIDFFQRAQPTQCSHGEEVLGAAKARLRELGATALEGNLVPVEIDFFANRAFAATTIRDYVATLHPDIQAALKPLIDQLVAMKRPKEGHHYTSLLYLLALYARLLSAHDTAIISSSFWLEYDLYRVVPRMLRTSEDVVLLSAALDDAVKIETFRELEPISSFYENRHEYSLILVGAETAPGTPYGMTSAVGDGISSVERGIGYSGAGLCITANLKGTSFSTPALGASLFAAAALSRARGEKMSRREAKTRLLLAADLRTSYVGQYASAGPPRFDLLAHRSGAVVITQSNRIQDVTISSGSFVARATPAGIAFPYALDRDEPGLRGLILRGGEAFVFSQSLMRWEKVIPVTLDLRISIAGKEETLTLDTFPQEYREILIL